VWRGGRVAVARFRDATATGRRDGRCAPGSLTLLSLTLLYGARRAPSFDGLCERSERLASELASEENRKNAVFSMTRADKRCCFLKKNSIFSLISAPSHFAKRKAQHLLTT